MRTVLKYFKHIAFVMIITAIGSCSDSFLDEDNINFDGIGSSSAIAIIPDMGEAYIPIYCQDGGNAKFSVSSAPDWLNIHDIADQFEDGKAWIICSASSVDEYSAYGAYYAILMLDIEGFGKFPMQICYISEGDPRIEIENDQTIDLFPYGQYGSHNMINISNRGEGILLFEVESAPEWASAIIQSSNILAPNEWNSILVLYSEYDSLKEDIMSGKSELSGEIVIVSNDRKRPKTSIKVTLNLGEAGLECYTEMIDFAREETQLEFSFANYGNGVMIWQIIDCPEWITLSQTSGSLSSYQTETLSVTCDRSSLPGGISVGTIKLKTNDAYNPIKDITVQCKKSETNPENVRKIEGTVTDAWIDKQSDVLYLSTARPNKLLAYDTKTKAVAYEIVLPNTPNCFSVSADKSKIAVGHDGKITYIDMDRHEIDNTVEVESQVFDIEWGDDNWLCYTPGTIEQNLCPLRWINTGSDERYESTNKTLYGGTIIKKVPNSNIIVAYCTEYGPTGIFLFDAQTKEMTGHFHEIAGHNFWFSQDGNYLFCSNKDVYRTSNLTDQNITPFTQLKCNSEIRWIDNDPANSSLWVIENNSDEHKVWQLETNDYNVERTVPYDDYYYTTVDGSTGEYPTEAHYVFASGNGEELFVIKNITTYGSNSWSIEHVDIPE
jgi:hypothetical protein